MTEYDIHNAQNIVVGENACENPDHGVRCSICGKLINVDSVVGDDPELLPTDTTGFICEECSQNTEPISDDECDDCSDDDYEDDLPMDEDPEDVINEALGN